MTIEYTPEGKAHILECMLDPKDRDYNLYGTTVRQNPNIYITYELITWIYINGSLQIIVYIS
jgi:hypothetical protein